MSATIEVLLFGSLRRRPSGTGDPSLRLPLGAPSPLRDVIATLGIPQCSVQLAMVNHRAVLLDELVRPRDRVALFPREYAVYVDWKDFRTPC